MNKGTYSEMTKERSIDVPIGEHGDGVELQLFTRRFIAMRLKGQTERVKTSLLTREQATLLRAALDELINELEPVPSDAANVEEATRLKAA